MEKEINMDELKAIYESSSPHASEAWNLLCEAREKVGWKNFYFMVLRMQKETSNGSNYKLLKSS